MTTLENRKINWNRTSSVTNATKFTKWVQRGFKEKSFECNFTNRKISVFYSSCRWKDLCSVIKCMNVECSPPNHVLFVPTQPNIVTISKSIFSKSTNKTWSWITHHYWTHPTKIFFKKKKNREKFQYWRNFSMEIFGLKYCAFSFFYFLSTFFTEKTLPKDNEKCKLIKLID